MIPFQHGVFATAAGAASGFEAIATVTLGSDSVVTFSSIPQGYVSLQIRGSVKTTAAGPSPDYELKMAFNADTGSNYAYHRLSGDGSSVTATGYSSTDPRISLLGASSSDLWTAVIIDIHEYSSTTKNTTARAFAGTDLNGSGNVGLTSELWLNTAAVTEIKFYPSSGWLKTGSTFALYGIKGAA